MNRSTIAHYQLAEKIGEGGMGEVFRATDTKLKREVALKILPDRFASDPERMARFSREAQVLASLNHPNIASIHGLEESEGRRALVMELVDGETIADRLGRGPIPFEEALRIGKQVAEALEEAHERGIVHRDLKPANVKITSSGVVKLLDFGLAKALEGDSAGSSRELSQSPTFSAAATAAGMILGTAGYMSPEQARGQKVDRRSDIWSFGIFLYEMLTGKPAFSGGTVSDVLASVLKTDIEWDAVPGDTPASIKRLLQRCLDRDSKHRLQSIGEARILIEEALAAGTTTRVSAPASAVAPRARSLGSIVPWALFAAAAVAAAILAFGRRSVPDELPLRLSVALESRPLYLGLGSSVVLSPDGSRLAYVSGDDNARELFVRSLDQSEGIKIVSGAGSGG
ncbi:MAG TPA: serine/threonine-protein kinase, partial [Vicinamibacteria bacterium]